MFLKHLIITNSDGLIRRIDFRMGVNLIIDDTPSGTEATGNNVGKTTILRLIDFCLGGDQKDIYTSTENGVNTLVKDFLKDTNVEVELCLADSLTKPNSREVKIRRNFIGGKKALREVDGKNVQQVDYDEAVQTALWGSVTDKPTFRQIISHSFRVDDLRLKFAMHTLNKYTSGTEYEALHLFMFGANLDDTTRKVALTEVIKADRTFKRRLEKKAGLSSLRSACALVEKQISDLEEQKAAYNMNPDFETDLEHLTAIKQTISQLGVLQNTLTLRRNLIREASGELESMKSNANTSEIAAIYQQAKAFNKEIHHSFEDLLNFHNEMLSRKANFITEELPELESQIKQVKKDIAEYREQEKNLDDKLKLSVTFEEFDKLISELTELYQQRGNLKQSIEQIEEVDQKIEDNEKIISGIDQDLFSKGHQDFVQEQLDKFNVHFSSISKNLYGESYAIGYEQVTSDNKTYYKFVSFATDNFSTGKKQGEIICFDLAYVTFADEEKIPCLHFVLNDKKELMHGNQLLRIAEQAEAQENVQYVASILSDKLPTGLDTNNYVVQMLSQDDRLFKIESSTWYLSKHSKA